MHGNKVHVQRRGNIMTVHLDSTGNPMPVASIDDQPPGAFPFTFTSERELTSHFPNREFVYHTPKSNNTIVNYDAEIERQALAMLGKEEGLKPAPTPVKVVQVGFASETSQQLLSSANSKQKAEEFLKRLQTALQYASKKHEKKLKDQVEIIEELIREVF